MKRRTFIRNSLAAGAGICLTPVSCIRNNRNATNKIDIPENWALLWNDEFNGNTIDDSKWQPSTEMPNTALNISIHHQFAYWH